MDNEPVDLKIIRFTAENIKKLTAVTISPTGNMVVLTGKNGSGKTSVLDAIWWALEGLMVVQDQPIKKGADTARIKLDMGDIIVTRTFKRDGEDGDKFTSTLTVESYEGAKYPSPQSMLDSLVGELSFDPLAFARMDDGTKFDVLKSFVKGFDFAQYDKDQKNDFEVRTAVNRKAKEAKALADTLNVPDNAPTEPVDVDALVTKLAEVGAEAARIEKANTLQTNKVTDAENVLQKLEDERDITETKIRETEEAIQKLQLDLHDLNNTFHTVKQEVEEAKLKVEKVRSLPLQAPPSSDAIKAQVDEAKTLNASWELRVRKDRALEDVKDLTAKAGELTKAMDDRTAAKLTAIQEAKMPLDGLTLTEDNQVFLNGVPFSQGSDAEQLRASVALGMSMNPSIKVLRVRDGSLLDEDGMKALSDMAELNGFQVWIERVDGSGKVGIVLENGAVKAVNQ